MQIKELGSPSLLPTVDALDAEFGCGDEQRAVGCKREGGAPRNARFTPTQFDFRTQPRAAKPTDATNHSSLEAPVMPPSLATRALRRPARFSRAFGVRRRPTLAWQA